VGLIGDPNDTVSCHFILVICTQFLILFKTVKEKNWLLCLGVYEAEEHWFGGKYSERALRASVRCRIRVWSLAESLYDHQTPPPIPWVFVQLWKWVVS